MARQDERQGFLVRDPILAAFPADKAIAEKWRLSPMECCKGPETLRD